MSRFYEELRTNAVDVALARAMNHVRTHTPWRDPRNWAAFRVVGAGMR